jgi:hypothetical protein
MDVQTATLPKIFGTDVTAQPSADRPQVPAELELAEYPSSYRAKYPFPAQQRTGPAEDDVTQEKQHSE